MDTSVLYSAEVRNKNAVIETMKTLIVAIILISLLSAWAFKKGWIKKACLKLLDSGDESTYRPEKGDGIWG